MNQQQVRKIKEYVRKLSGLCDGEPIPSHKTSGNGHWESCERDAYQAGEIQDKARRAYRERVLALLEADADDWVFIARIFEGLRPQWFSRIDSLRQNILLHTDPDKKYQNWLEPQKGKLNPNKYLRVLIEQFRNELLYEADLAKSETGGNATPATIINIAKIDKLGVLGDVQAESVQTGDNSSIHKQTITGEKNKSIIWKILKIIGAIAALLTILHYLGWLEPIKEFIRNILLPK